MHYSTHQRIAKSLGVLSDKINKTTKKIRYYDGDFPIHFLEIHVVEAIGDNGEIRVTDLANVMKLTKGTISLYVTRLSRKGLVSKAQREGNKKEVYVRLTPLGRQAYQGHQSFHRRVYEHPAALPLREDPLYSEENCKIITRFIEDYCKIYDVMMDESFPDRAAV